MTKSKKIPIHTITESFSGMNIGRIGTQESFIAPHEISLPHRHEHYFCILVEKGEMEILVDFNKVILTPDTVFMSYPGQIHQFISRTDCEGWILFFDDTLIGEKARTLLDQFLAEIITMDLSVSQAELIRNMLGTINYVYQNGRGSIFRKQTLQSLLLAFVYEISSIYSSSENKKLVQHSARQINMAKTFWQLLRKDTVIKKPSDFAMEMNITTGYLNDVVKKVTGYTVTDVIQKEVIKEAQRLIIYSSLSLKAIAEKLGFNDYRYFLRVFGKTAGQSPGAFRDSFL
ncbi:AraC family transcriptional regulator [Pedobacter caeni]|uniref:Cupin domain-containing protein n=1 Tax=Pedobacter caeni TaxID=288992 RepID=A0A1M4W5W9_9SPHI|nr:AraC family transcriptional regulator [Pedobacter caeni]SHE76493.1 Cupin domain-containing protein [Pedobacter caeni]